MLFAAGFGTRMGKLTRTTPKPLVPVADRPLIDHALALVDGAGIATRLANLHYLPEQLESYLEPLGVAISHETPDILGTGGGLRAARTLLGESPVFTMNTDTIWAGPNPLTLLGQAWCGDKMDALLICVPIADALAHDGPGDFSLDVAGRIARGPGYVYGGVQIIRTEVLDRIAARIFSLNKVWDLLIAEGRCFGLLYPGKWCNVGHPDGIAEAERLLSDYDV
ncbi:MAG: nucleotidyltransferase family protein [Rhodobacteraceae bacterium]|nr:nucleotidyltransferase family protein [Paracoccaceae bacterium]